MALRCAVIGVVSASLSGCFLVRDPLDPLDELDHRVVPGFEQSEREARGRRAYERARERIDDVEKGMSIAEVEVAMRAMVVTEGEEEVEDRPRRKVIEGWLCELDPSPVRRRWLFGYDESGVELIGFGIEFTRRDPEDDDWEVRSIERDPRDGCPDGSGE
jgi:hypothetical protein